MVSSNLIWLNLLCIWNNNLISRITLVILLNSDSRRDEQSIMQKIDFLPMCINFLLGTFQFLTCYLPRGTIFSALNKDHCDSIIKRSAECAFSASTVHRNVCSNAEWYWSRIFILFLLAILPRSWAIFKQYSYFYYCLVDMIRSCGCRKYHTMPLSEYNYVH